MTATSDQRPADRHRLRPAGIPGAGGRWRRRTTGGGGSARTRDLKILLVVLVVLAGMALALAAAISHFLVEAALYL